MKICTEALASAVPEMVKLDVWLVILSELLTPESSAAARSRPAGAAGVLASIVTVPEEVGADV